MVNPSDISNLPWLEPYKEQIKNLINNHKLPRVILLHGPEGMGKSILADDIANIINPAANNIPVFGQDNTKITVDDIRDIIDRAQRTTDAGHYNVFVIKNCENMASAAANALLKTLEENNENNYFILTTDNYNKILPTILSRCFKIAVSAEPEVIYNWLSSQGIADRTAQLCLLELADFGPRKALDYFANGYMDKLYKTSHILGALNQSNLIHSHKQTVETMTIKENKKNIIDIASFIKIINYLLTKSFIENASPVFSKPTFELIKKYKNHLDNNIAIDASNVIYNILYSIQRG